MEHLIEILEYTLLLIAGIPAAYLASLSILALFRRRRGPGPATIRRFAVVVPAHDEEITIERTVRSLLGQDYPAERFDVIVVADNCTDRTAERARQLGARVEERKDPGNRGKGRALRWIFDRLLVESPPYDAVAVIDADTVAEPGFLTAMNACLGQGAQAAQGNDLVAPNPGSWSTEVTRLGFLLQNTVRPLGRSVLGCSAGLKGNGMCFTTDLLKHHPWDAFGVTEDLQYGLSLLLKGIRVEFAPEARVLAAMPASPSNAVTQRRRWEGGRAPVKRVFSRTLLTASLKGFSARLLDAWLDLVIPPFVQFTALVLFVVTGHAAGAALGDATAVRFLPWWIGILLMCLGHVVIGLVAAGADRGLYRALLYVPRYALWKLRILHDGAGNGTPREWIRTTRESEMIGTEADRNSGGRSS